MTVRLFVALLAALLFLLAPFPAHASDPVTQAGLSIASLDHEVAIVFDAGMRQFARFEGGATSTQVRVTYRWRNGVMIHNHPYPTLPSLSILDLATCAAGDVRECRVYSVSMGYVMVCRAWKIGRWPRFNVPLLRAQVRTVIDYYPWLTQAQNLEGYITGLSRQLGFGYVCGGPS